jgi:hypothetical protein
MAEDNPKLNQNQVELQIKQEVAQGNYANLVMITHSNSEFILDFASMLPGMPGPTVSSRVIMAPEHAKRLLAALQENIYKYEQQFGKIELQNQQPRTIAPFPTGKGEA